MLLQRLERQPVAGWGADHPLFLLVLLLLHPPPLLLQHHVLEGIEGAGLEQAVFFQLGEKSRELFAGKASLTTPGFFSC